MKNDTLPCEVTQDFGTVEANQENVLLQVMENEVSDELLEIENAVSIGKAVLETSRSSQKVPQFKLHLY